MRMKTVLFPVLASLAAASSLSPARGAECRVAKVDFTPEAGLQIAVWLEDPQGNFIDTLYITQSTGSYGLGNRPGREDMDSGIKWPYGRREGVLPVWAHRRGASYPMLDFQDTRDEYLSHGLEDSSPEAFYCRPTLPSEIDIGTCPSPTSTGTDKGVFDASKTSYYPPRNDITSRYKLGTAFTDSADVLMYGTMNDLDAVSRATPQGGQPFEILSALDPSLPAGDYVVWVEVSKEFDYNATYNPDTYPTSPTLAQTEYGDPYRGQPSVVWKIPFTLASTPTSASTKDYVGYGNIDGQNGDLNPPDATINDTATTFTYDQDGIGTRPPIDYPSLGQARLQLLTDGGNMYRIKLSVEPSSDGVPPGAPPAVAASDLASDTATVTFTSPGDDGQTGTPTQYEIRYLAGTPLTEANFDTGTLLGNLPAPRAAGQQVTFALGGLTPKTHYYVGVRAKDECLSNGALAFADFVTLEGKGGSVDGCFVATAAFGSLLEKHVVPLRKVRDKVLRTQVLGELFVEAYYTFGPAFAETIEPSQDLRELARTGLTPLVDFAESLL
jgi:hypothetical protein